MPLTYHLRAGLPDGTEIDEPNASNERVREMTRQALWVDAACNQPISREALEQSLRKNYGRGSGSH